MKSWRTLVFGIFLGLAAGAVVWLVSQPPRSSAIELLPAPTPGPILVQVDGAVSQPGVYELPLDSRVREAVQAAGGLRQDANPSAVNFAARVKDGEKLVIPYAGTSATPEGTHTGSEKSKPVTEGTPAGPINLNSATLEELERLPGIGATRAQDIIQYREAHNGFQTIDEIQEVPGIGPATFERLKSYITVD